MQKNASLLAIVAVDTAENELSEVGEEEARRAAADEAERRAAEEAAQEARWRFKGWFSAVSTNFSSCL